MNTKCKCGKILQKAKWQEMTQENVIIWECPSCGNTIKQRKRTSYKLNAERDIVNIKRHIEKLLERNPITDKNKDEWKKFIRAYIALYVELNGVVEKITITL